MNCTYISNKLTFIKHAMIHSQFYSEHNFMIIIINNFNSAVIFIKVLFTILMALVTQ